MTKYSSSMLMVTTAIALVGGFVLGAPSVMAQKAGVTTAVNTDANRTPPGAARRQIVLGDEIVYNERIDTDASGQAQVLMLDRTALSIGPNSSMVIDKFVYDPGKKSGDMALTLRKGLMRFVGGNISKTQRVEVKTPVGVLGVRGGIALFEVIDDNTVDATFLFGDDLVMFRDGVEIGRIITPGYASRVTPDGAGAPQKVTPQQIAQKMGQLQGRAGSSGGLSETPNSEEVSSQAASSVGSEDAGTVDTAGAAAGTTGGQTDLSKGISDSQNIVVENHEEPIVAVHETAFVGLARRYDNTVSPSLFTGVNEITDIEGSFTIFNNGDEIYSLNDPNTPESVLAGPAFELLLNGEGPDLILNPFDATDTALYSRPETAFDALVTAGMDAAAARIVVGREIYQDDFIHLTYRALVVDDIQDNRITVTAGVPFTNFPSTGVWSYETDFDVMRYSRHLFSAVNTVELHTGSGAIFRTNTFQLGANANQTPLFIDWAHGKVFYASSVISGDFLGQTEFAFQAGVVVGDINDLGEFTIAGSEIVNGQIDGNFRSNITATNANLLQFYTDSAQYLTIGGTLQRAGHTLDTVQTDVQYLAERTSNPFLSSSMGLGTYELYTATRLSLGASGLFSLLSDGSAVTMNDAPGTLTLDRDNHEVAATINLHSSGMDDSFTLSGPNFISAYLTDELYGIASFNLVGATGGFLVSGSATAVDAGCTCEHLLWGYWGLLEDDDTSVANNSRAQVGVFVAGQPTLDMPITGFVQYSGVTEAAWKAPLLINPDEVTTYANGTFELLVNMATGDGTGLMTLANVEYTVLSTHVVGLPQVSLDFTENGLNGGAGFGSGIFAGPGANNLAATYRLTADDGMRAAGVIRADGAASPGPTMDIFGDARITPGDPDIDLPSVFVNDLAGVADGFGFYSLAGGPGVLAGFFPDLISSRSGTSVDILNPFDATDTLTYMSPDQTVQTLVGLGVDTGVANRLVGPVVNDGDFLAQTYFSLTNDIEPDLVGALQVAGGVEYDVLSFLDNSQSLVAYELDTDPVRFSRHAFSTVGQFDDSVEFIADFSYVLDGSTVQTPLYLDLVRGRVFLANKVQFGDPTNLTSEYAFSVGVVAGTIGDTGTLAGSGELVFGNVGTVQQDSINSGGVGFLQGYGENGDRIIVAGNVEIGESTTADPVQLDFVHLGTSVVPGIILDDGDATVSYTLLGATVVQGVSTMLFNNFVSGEPLSTRLTNAGNLVIDRNNGTVSATINFGTTGTPRSEAIVMDGPNYQSAYLSDQNFGIASTGFQGNEGGFLVSGKAMTLDDPCVCEYLHWGYWAVFEDNNGVPENARSSIGVFVAGEPTVIMPISGSATYEGSVEAAWRQSTPLNPNGLVTFATGSISHTVQFATGVGSGAMDLGPDNFNTSSIHTPGNANVNFTFTGIGASVGRNGIGNGIFTGPNAENLGVVMELNGPNGFAAAGAIRAKQVVPLGDG